MRKILLVLLLTVLFAPFSTLHAFSEKGQDCSKCHTLSTDEASALLKDLIPNVKVSGIMASPVKGMWEVDVEANGKKGLVYVDFSKKFLISGGIINIKEKKNLSQDRMAELNRIDLSKIPLDDALVMGDKEAKKKVIVFDDPD